jgi:hypothetical protein
VELTVTGPIIEWRGPSPFHFVEVPDDESAAIDSVKALITYGWGAIPVEGRIGRTEFRTSLFPRNERYLIPLKDAVRRAEGVALGDMVEVRLTLDV